MVDIAGRFYLPAFLFLFLSAIATLFSLRRLIHCLFSANADHSHNPG